MSKSQENIHLIQSLYAAFGRGDLPFILSKLTDDVSWEFEATPELTWSGVGQGHQQALHFFTNLAAEHENPVLDMPEFLANDDTVASFGRYQSTERGTGVRVDTPVAHYWKIRDGKVCRYVNIINSAAYLKAKEAGAKHHAAATR
jgi:ketosteroid isomerase-like protein